MKFKFKKNNLDINLVEKPVSKINVLFTFNNDLLKQSSTIIKKNHLDVITDLSKAKSYHIHEENSFNFLVFSLGAKNKFNLATYISVIKHIGNFLVSNKNIKEVDITLEDYIQENIFNNDNELFVEQTIFNMVNGMYYLDQFKSNQHKIHLESINFISKINDKSVSSNAIALLNGLFLLKDLANLPANIVTPSYIANSVKDFTKLSKKVEVKILGENELKKLNMNSLLSVAKGSAEEPKFIELVYNGGKDKDKPIVLVGKGVTFDSGGISLKPSANMDEMKYDMCGAASVISVFHAVVEMGLSINLVVLAACVENMPSGHATKPGDIVKSMSGKTIEILNTDAEGRLILCDALTYAEKFNPKLVIDVATLTGAVITALGYTASGLFSNDDKLANELINSGNRTNDKVWQLPLFEEYKEELVNSIADISNIAAFSPAAGSSIGAIFLAQFVNYKWAHLDIANTSWSRGKFNGISNNHGATGRPFYLLMDFIRNHKNVK